MLTACQVPENAMKLFHLIISKHEIVNLTGKLDKMLFTFKEFENLILQNIQLSVQ